MIMTEKLQLLVGGYVLAHRYVCENRLGMHEWTVVRLTQQLRGLAPAKCSVVVLSDAGEVAEEGLLVVARDRGFEIKDGGGAMKVELHCETHGCVELGPFTSLEEASKSYSALRDETLEGMSTFGFGAVMAGGKKTHEISYNGKVWVFGGTRSLAFDPFATQEVT